MSKRKLGSRKKGGILLIFLIVLLVAGGRLLAGLGEGERIVWVDRQGQVEVRQLAAEQPRRWRLPGELLVPVKGMQGQLRLESLLEFAEDEGEPFEIVRRSLEILLGVEIETVIYQKKPLWIGGRRKNYGLVIKKIAWWWRGQQRGESSWQKIDWPAGLGEEKLRPDGTKIREVEREEMWAYAREVLGTGRLRSEETGVRVINASEWGGMGYLATAMLEAEGAVVVEVRAEEPEQMGCRAEGEGMNQIVKWMRTKWDCELSRKAGEDVTVRLGEEWGERYQRQIE